MRAEVPLTAADRPAPDLPAWLRLARRATATALLCIAVAAFLGAVFRQPFWPTLVISLCIGGCIQALIEGGRRLIAAWLIRRGHTSAELRGGWPGWSLMGPYVLVCALLGYAIGLTLGRWLIGLPAIVPFGDDLRSLTIVLGITAAVSIVVTHHFYVRGQMATVAARAEAALRLAGDNQLRLLQSQLEPHMLFNTLANLRVLVTLDPPRAQAMLDHLIRYLRATLGASQRTLHPLAVEFERLDDYLALMALRMGPRLQVALVLPAELRALPVPPLLLQPLVENSIRHGLEPQVAGGRIEVRARRQGHTLVLTVRDTGIGLQVAPLTLATPHGDSAAALDPSAGGGFGTHHVAERLATLYGDRCRFSLRPADDAEGGTLAELQLPLPADADLPADPPADPPAAA